MARGHLVKKYERLKKKCVFGKKKDWKEKGWRILIASRPILRGHIIVQAIDKDGETIKVKGGLKHQLNKEILKKAFEGVIEGINLLRDKIRPERIYLGCFSDSGELHFHLYPIQPGQKPYNGRALEWLSKFEMEAGAIPEEDKWEDKHISEIQRLIKDVEWAIKKLKG